MIINIKYNKNFIFLKTRYNKIPYTCIHPPPFIVMHLTLQGIIVCIKYINYVMNIQ